MSEVTSSPASETTSGAGDPFASVRSRLATLRRGLRWYYLVHGICWTIAVGSLCALALLMIHVFLKPPTAVLGVLVAGAALFTLSIVIRKLIYPVTRQISDIDLVVLIEREYPLLNDRLVSALQLISYQGPAAHSAVMVKSLFRDAEELAGTLDFREVLKPNRIAPIGFVAAFASLALCAGSVAAALHVDTPTRLGIVLDFPTQEFNRTNLDINFARQPSGRPGVAGLLVAADGSDIVVIARPSGADTLVRDFSLQNKPAAQLVMDSPGLGRTREDMEVARDDLGNWVYRSQIIATRDMRIRVEWMNTRTLAYDVVTKPAPRIDNHEILYRVPDYNRAPDVVVEPEAGGSYPARVVTGDKWTVSRPKLDENGVPVTDDDGNHELVELTFDSEAAFEASEPDVFGAWARQEASETHEINYTEEGDVIFRIECNKPLDGEASYLQVKRSARANIRVSEGDESVAPPQTVWKFRKLDAEGRHWETRVRLETGMIAYSFHLVDLDGLRPAEEVEFSIKVRSDQPPTARFEEYGVPLVEGSSDRYLTKKGTLPLLVRADDEFGLMSLRLMFRHSKMPEGEWTEITDFNRRGVVPGNGRPDGTVASRIGARPSSLTVRYVLSLWELLRDVTTDENEDLAVSLKLLATDTKDQTNERSAAPLNLTIWSPDRMRSEIRRILRNVIKPRVQELARYQAGLINATGRFKDRPELLAEGIAIRSVFPNEDRTVDSRGRDIMFTGTSAVHRQNKITDDARTLARRIDAIVRHYVRNDLEGDDDKATQETTLQKVKVLLALLCVEKKVALELNKNMSEIHNARTPEAQKLDAIQRMLEYLLTEPVDYVDAARATRGEGRQLRLLEVRRGHMRAFSRQFAMLSGQVRADRAALSLESALRYEAALSETANQAAIRSALDECLEMQQAANRAFIQILDLMRQWEGFEEQREALRRINDGVRDIERQLRENESVIRQLNRLNDSNPRVQIDACERLAALGKVARRAIPRLKELLNDANTDPRVKTAINEAIEEIEKAETDN